MFSKLEVLVEFGSNPNQQLIYNTVNKLRATDGVKEAIYKDGAFMVETDLPSSIVLDVITRTSGRRAVLQGFGDTQSAVAMVSGAAIVGVIRFQQAADSLVGDGTVDGLLPHSVHGLHVHEVGDLSQGCKSIGGHYNPFDTPHGSPQDPVQRRHAGDLGNIMADENGRATFRIVDPVLKVWDVIGRSIAISEKEDDLGRGSSPRSRIDGDSGTPIACGIIARSAGIFQNPKRVCACDGVVVWDERDRPLAGKGRREPTCCAKESANAAHSDLKRCCKF